MTTFRQAVQRSVAAPARPGRFLTKPCPKCHGRGKVPNILLPGRHVCRRCDGTGHVPTWAARLLEHASGQPDPDQDDLQQDNDLAEIIRRLLRRWSGHADDY